MTPVCAGPVLPVTQPASSSRISPFAIVLSLLLAASASPAAHTQQYDPAFYAGMQWRQVGPFRAGRVTSVSGVAGNPAIYYMATAGGGAWKTTNGGLVWKPIFDQQHIASIGAIAVAPSNPNIVYLGTGDVSNVGGAVNQGNGMWRSDDAGQSWRHIGLEDSRHIGVVWVDPRNPDVVFAAALGHTYAKSTERGVFKSTDGGKNWRRVLYKDDVTGAIDVAFAPDNPNIGFAALWGHYVQPGNPMALLQGSGTAGIYKTADGGETWTQVTGSGLPTGKLGRIGVVIAPGSKRVFAIIAVGRGGGGLYRSDDSGATWRKITEDPRVVGNGYFSRVFLDPHNSDIVYVAQTSLYRSDDGGLTFSAYKGAPGGDDNHVLWIDPTDSKNMIMGSDQGATVSMDGGRTWSSWYNQPTGQIYHLSVDNRFPYWIYGTQQDSGAIATLSRGDYGAITMLDWDPLGGYEFGYVLPDPANPNIVYCGGENRGLWRIDRSNRQVMAVSPNVSRDTDYRVALHVPLAFSPQGPHVLYEGMQLLLQTSDGGVTWKAISPDLTKRPESEAEARQRREQEQKAKQDERKKPKSESQEEEEILRPPDRSAITVVAPSPLQKGQIWVGTNNGVVQLTTDNGANWRNISPPGLQKYSEIAMVEASPFDAAAAYVPVDNHQLNDFRPHIFRTRDFGKSWQETVAGIPDFSFVKVVRADPARKGLLYAGTETGGFVSFDDGDHWQSLQLNLPTVSVRDLVVHDDDLVAATYGRAFWILDDLSPLRQLNSEVATAAVHLFKPATSLRLRNNLNQDTPFPPEMPAGDNPPTGAVFDYYLKSVPAGDVTLAIYDPSGKPVRELSSKPQPPSGEEPPEVPNYWLAHPTPLPKNPGTNRYVWDLRYPAPDALRHSYPISALYESTHPEPQGPFVVPGNYEARLTVDGKTYTQAFTVKMDPRVSVTQAALEQQLELQSKVDALVSLSYQFHQRSAKLREAVADRQKGLEQNEQAKATLQALKDFDAKAGKMEGQQTRGYFPTFGKPKPTFTQMNSETAALSETVDLTDAAPTAAMQEAYRDYCQDMTKLAEQWSALLKQNLPGLNAKLSTAKLAPLPEPAAAPELPACGQ